MSWKRQAICQTDTRCTIAAQAQAVSEELSGRVQERGEDGSSSPDHFARLKLTVISTHLSIHASSREDRSLVYRSAIRLKSLFAESGFMLAGFSLRDLSRPAVGPSGPQTIMAKIA